MLSDPDHGHPRDTYTCSPVSLPPVSDFAESARSSETGRSADSDLAGIFFSASHASPSQHRLWQQCVFLLTDNDPKW